MKKEPVDSGNIKQTQFLNLAMLRLGHNHSFLNKVKNMGDFGYSVNPNTRDSHMIREYAI
jgi:hypothetical protein